MMKITFLLGTSDRPGTFFTFNSLHAASPSYFGSANSVTSGATFKMAMAFFTRMTQEFPKQTVNDAKCINQLWHMPSMKKEKGFGLCFELYPQVQRQRLYITCYITYCLVGR